MHDYYTPKYNRVRIYYFIGILASFIFGQILLAPSWFETSAPQLARVLHLVVPSISGLLVFIAGHWLFSNVIWKAKWTQRLALREVPNLDGIWKGTVQPFLREGQPENERPKSTPVTVIVEQTFDKISLTLEIASKNAGSISTMARLERQNDYSVDVKFGYRGWSKKQGGQVNYDGETELRFTKELVVNDQPMPFPTAKGKYYTDERRSTRGEMELSYYGPR